MNWPGATWGQSRGTLPSFAGLFFLRLGANGRETMSEHLKDEIWDLAAGTIIAVSVVSGVAYVIASAIH